MNIITPDYLKNFATDVKIAGTASLSAFMLMFASVATEFSKASSDAIISLIVLSLLATARAGYNHIKLLPKK